MLNKQMEIKAWLFIVNEIISFKDVTLLSLFLECIIAAFFARVNMRTVKAPHIFLGKNISTHDFMYKQT